MNLLDEILENHDKPVVDEGFNDDEGTCYKCLEDWTEAEICRTCEMCPDCCECESGKCKYQDE